MALEGTIRDFGLADIFQLIGLQKKTGVLTVRGEAGNLVTVSFEKGTVVFADIDPTYNAFEQGRCDAVTSDKSQLASRRIVFKAPDDYEIMDEEYPEVSTAIDAFAGGFEVEAFGGAVPTEE